MLKHHKKLRELSVSPKTGEVDMRKLKSKAFKKELLKVLHIEPFDEKTIENLLV